MQTVKADVIKNEIEAGLLTRIQGLPPRRVFTETTRLIRPAFVLLSRYAKVAAADTAGRGSAIPEMFILDDDPNYGSAAEISARLTDEMGVPVTVRALTSGDQLRGMSPLFYIPQLDGVWDGGGIMSTYFSARKFGLEQVMQFNSDAWPQNAYGLVIEALRQDYYDQNRDKILRCYNAMADEASRTTFAAGLQARLSGDCTILPIAPYPQYCHPTVHAERGDIFVEAGVEDGETTAMFAKAVGADGIVIGFEPVKSFHVRINERLAQYENVTLEPLGLWSEPSKLYIDMAGGGSSVQAEAKAGAAECDLVDLDGYLAGRPITMLKMDIESAELPALRGADRVIRKWRPKLAICVYHNPRNQFVDIIDHILGLDLDYTLFLGHHSPIVSETVLYALPA